MRPRVLLSRLFVLALVGCASTVPSEDKPCPCADGYVCCSSGVCAKDQASCTASTRSELEQARGVWKGYVENFKFESGVDTISVTVEIGSDGAPIGKVVLGKQDAPPPPTDPNVGWPPHQSWTFVGKIPDYVEGFAYDGRGVNWENRRLRFKIASREAWQSWCALQTPIMWPLDTTGGTPTYGCLGNGGYTFGGDTCSVGSDMGQIPVDCGKLALCFINGACACTATACAADLQDDISVDIALRDGIGDGSISLSGQNYNVRVTQMH